MAKIKIQVNERELLMQRCKDFELAFSHYEIALRELKGRIAADEAHDLLLSGFKFMMDAKRIWLFQSAFVHLPGN